MFINVRRVNEKGSRFGCLLLFLGIMCGHNSVPVLCLFRKPVHYGID
jgi:hypothetical protein